MNRVCILKEGQNLNHKYTRNAVLSLAGKTVYARRASIADLPELYPPQISVEEVDGVLYAFVPRRSIPDGMCAVFDAMVGGDGTVTEIVGVSFGAMGECALMSEDVLARDWLSADDDEAWSDL